MRVVTCNLRCKDDAEGSIKRRAALLRKALLPYDADILCLQECTSLWRFFLRLYFGKFKAFYRDRGTGEGLCILLRRNAFITVQKGMFYLAENPDDANSMPFERRYDCNRICTYLLLRRKTDGREFLVVNTHLGFDEPERIKSAELILRYTRSITDAQRIIAGDFNADRSSPTYRIFTAVMTDANADDTTPTYNGYGKTQNPSRIDFIFTDNGIMSVSGGTISDTEEGYYSDHFAVWADLFFSEAAYEN